MNGADGEKKQIEENALSMKQAMEAARKSANDLEELNHVLRDQVEQLQKKAAHYDEIVKISAAIKSENEQLSRQQEELSRQLANETAAKKDYEEQTGKLTAMVRDLEHAAAENKMQLAGLNSQLKEQETDCRNRLKQAQMQADLAMERLLQPKNGKCRKNSASLTGKMPASSRNLNISGHLLMLLPAKIQGILRSRQYE